MTESDLQRVGFQFFQCNKLECGGMSCFKIDRGRAIMVQRTFPPRDADAPFVARLKSRKAQFRMRRDKIVPVEHREIEKFPRHFHADRMQAHIFRPRATKAVAIKAGHWIAATAFEFRSEDVSWHVAILALEIKFARFWIMGNVGKGGARSQA